jgi:hypothetical protein
MRELCFREMRLPQTSAHQQRPDTSSEFRHSAGRREAASHHQAALDAQSWPRTRRTHTRTGSGASGLGGQGGAFIRGLRSGEFRRELPDCAVLTPAGATSILDQSKSHVKTGVWGLVANSRRQASRLLRAGFTPSEPGTDAARRWRAGSALRAAGRGAPGGLRCSPVSLELRPAGGAPERSGTAFAESRADLARGGVLAQQRGRNERVRFRVRASRLRTRRDAENHSDRNPGWG